MNWDERWQGDAVDSRGGRAKGRESSERLEIARLINKRQTTTCVYRDRDTLLHARNKKFDDERERKCVEVEWMGMIIMKGGSAGFGVPGECGFGRTRHVRAPS